jgi:hypothetical protein
VRTYQNDPKATIGITKAASQPIAVRPRIEVRRMRHASHPPSTTVATTA